MENQVDYQKKAALYAKELGMTKYEYELIEVNIFHYITQVTLRSPRIIEVYDIKVNLDTMEEVKVLKNTMGYI